MSKEKIEKLESVVESLSKTSYSTIIKKHDLEKSSKTKNNNNRNIAIGRNAVCASDQSLRAESIKNKNTVKINIKGSKPKDEKTVKTTIKKSKYTFKPYKEALLEQDKFTLLFKKNPQDFINLCIKKKAFELKEKGLLKSFNLFKSIPFFKNIYNLNKEFFFWFQNELVLNNINQKQFIVELLLYSNYKTMPIELFIYIVNNCDAEFPYYRILKKIIKSNNDFIYFINHIENKKKLKSTLIKDYSEHFSKPFLQNKISNSKVINF